MEVGAKKNLDVVEHGCICALLPNDVVEEPSDLSSSLLLGQVEQPLAETQINVDPRPSMFGSEARQEIRLARSMFSEKKDQLEVRRHS